MSEDEADSRRDERPRWLEIALVVLPPLSLISALLVYFSAVQRGVFAKALGLNIDLLEEPSTLNYLLSSTKVVFFPLAVASIGLLLWLSADRAVRRWAGSRVHLIAISRAGWALPASAVALVLGLVLAARVSPDVKLYLNDLLLPFVLALAVLMAAYGASLRRLAGGKGSRLGSVGRRWAINALIGLLVSLLLFWGMDNFATVVGRGKAGRILDQPQLFTNPVLIYSAQDLQLDPTEAVRQELPGGDHTAYRYRYQGLRLAFVDGDRYFLIGRNWRTRGGMLIILVREGLRVEFPRGTG